MARVKQSPRSPASARQAADDLVFRALADPTRRALLDRLFVREGLSLTALDGAIDSMSRFGVMKHLRMLEAAGLVVTRKQGREKLHYLNPVPVQLIHNRWVSKYTRPRAAALAGLKQALERRDDMAKAPRQVYQVFIQARPEEIWEAITKPEFTARYFYGSRVTTTGTKGASLKHYAPDGTTLWGDNSVLESDPPKRFVHTWRALYDKELAAEPPSRVTWEIEPQPSGVVKLTVIHDQLDGSPKTAKSVAGGWMFIISGLKTLLETGRPLSPRSEGQPPP
jgi:uncharacterized protein YndB with AHSA1/START domain/DNA-binding transcriptional ArsR family regulator